MSSFRRQDHWQDVYVSKGESEVSWFQESPEPSLELLKKAGASQSSSVIDIGGGASRLVDRLVEEGFGDLTVLDLSEAALAASRTRLGDRGTAVEWIAADVTQWRPRRTYDFWHDRAAFHFLVDEPDREAYVERLVQALPVGAHAIIGTFAPDGPEKCSGLPVQRYDSERLAEVLGQRFELLGSLCHRHLTPWNSEQRFQFSTFKRVS